MTTGPQAPSFSGEYEAFGLLRDSILQSVRQRPCRPRRQLLEDQIIWGRCPVRLDLAGGWTDTPPYCLTHGGRVVNVAVNLNGQPPIQIFAKLSSEPHIVLRSIDLGVEGRITTFDELRRCAEPLGAFSIAKAALSLAGFLPEFAVKPTFDSLRQQLEEFGCGLEISLLAAVPKGSGLGTSSILAATLLGSLGELCGLGWDHAEIYRRALALEQMLTTGGGWQDQVGGVARGLKRIDTLPGLQQDPTVRWLPADLFTDPATKSCMLLYYTGITRVAKSILKEIVRGMFLGETRCLAVLDELGEHAAATYEVLARAVGRSLRLHPPQLGIEPGARRGHESTGSPSHTRSRAKRPRRREAAGRRRRRLLADVGQGPRCGCANSHNAGSVRSRQKGAIRRFQRLGYRAGDYAKLAIESWRRRGTFCFPNPAQALAGPWWCSDNL